jgi:hypothetical protein
MEFATLVAVLAAALISMQIYVKRSVSGKLRDAADSIGEQYAPQRTVSAITTTSGGTTRSTSKLITGKALNFMETTTEIGVDGNLETVHRSGTETVGPFQNSIWDN